ncbi:hypothetical protein OKW22_001104 [Bacilli bacterium PM5-3]|nr:hypothetical protein [Bacilli bacterium PM5-3]MDH6603665.1 hypothetical protein [Bacilli bacterium PM5-9]
MKDTITNFISELRSFDSIAIIGLSKNAGKTTTLNSVLKLLNYENVMLTSIGYDGEETDLVFGTGKPTIFVKKGTLLATAKKCVLSSDIRFEILETTGFNTPLGEIIIVKCLEDGLIELAGPSYNSQLKEVIRLLKELGNGLVLVDGALNRKTFSDPSVCDRTILCSGMTLSDDINEVAKQTLYSLQLLSLKRIDKIDCELVVENFNDAITIVNKDNSIKNIEALTAINQEVIIAKNLDKDSKYLLINGPLTDKLALQLIKTRSQIDALCVVVKNGTSVFVKEETFNQLKKANIDIRVIDEINVCAISMNPNSLYRQFDSKEVVAKVASQTDKLVYDFVGGN